MRLRLYTPFGGEQPNVTGVGGYARRSQTSSSDESVHSFSVHRGVDNFRFSVNKPVLPEVITESSSSELCCSHT